ncbi:MAG: DUF2341 domain-containing protein [Fibrobacterota bacterium]|nr:DUF2341 domain-containing protein [Fibrobacterota bacterium]
MKSERPGPLYGLRGAAFLLAAILAGCFQFKSAEVAGGGGVETTGGAIASLSGNLKGARVRMIPADYNPLLSDVFPDSLETTTRDDGTFSLKGLPPGAYNLDVWQPGDDTRLFLAGISVVKGVSATLPVDTLRASSRVRLHLESVKRGILFQPGTANQRRLDYVEADSVTLILDSLPSGTLPPIYLADSATQPAPIRLTDSLKTLPGATSVPGAFTLWSHQGIWSIDSAVAAQTMTDGAGDYPILLRLSKPDFDFTEALPNGGDVRFSDADGNALASEIESWDAAAGIAAVWVGLKRSGGKADRKILMHWGKADAAAPDWIGPVFDTAAGFVGVWHFSEAGNNRKNGYQDATQTGLDGWGTSMIQDSATAGLIAGSQYFDGLDGSIRMDDGPLGWTGAMMVSAWVSPGFDSGESRNRVFLSRWEEKNSAGFWLEYAPDIKGVRFGLGLAAPGKIFTVDAPGIVFTQDSWHHVAAAYDGITAILYWDGVEVARSVHGPAAMVENIRDLLIGAKGNVNPDLAEIQFHLGRMDEVRIYRTVKGPGWISLDYQTQKPGGGIARWTRIR